MGRLLMIILEKKSLILIVFLGLLQSCAENSTNTTSTDPNQKSGTTDLSQAIFGGTVYYTGYDGVTDFSIYVNTSRGITIHDPTVATAQQVNITVDDSTVATQVAEIEAVYTANGETMSTRRKNHIEGHLRNPEIWKIIPLKSGVTTISAEREGRPESIWSTAETRTVVVSDYTASQLEIGRQRYETPLGNTACTQCHNESFGEAAGAPPHLLGRVLLINDSDVAQWITTGQVKTRQASVAHRWTFQSDEEKFATVAYLRSKQTPDEQAFAKLLFEERLTETKAEFEAQQ